MTKKKSGVESIIGTFSSVIMEFLFGTVKIELQNIARDLINTFEKAAKRMGKMFAQYMLVFFVALIGFFFFLISLVLITVDYFQLTLGGGLFIWGILLLIVAFMYSQLIQKEEK
jgi:hypothetical protein